MSCCQAPSEGFLGIPIAGRGSCGADLQCEFKRQMQMSADIAIRFQPRGITVSRQPAPVATSTPNRQPPPVLVPSIVAFAAVKWLMGNSWMVVERRIFGVFADSGGWHIVNAMCLAIFMPSGRGLHPSAAIFDDACFHLAGKLRYGSRIPLSAQTTSMGCRPACRSPLVHGQASAHILPFSGCRKAGPRMTIVGLKICGHST